LLKKENSLNFVLFTFSEIERSPLNKYLLCFFLDLIIGSEDNNSFFNSANCFFVNLVVELTTEKDKRLSILEFIVISAF
jgi:predicted HAD superfamily hydrolase